MTRSQRSLPDGARVLLVEDDLDQAHLLRFFLEEAEGIQVTLAQDGVRGTELARKGGWTLVITDLNLPGAYGMSVIGESRSAHPAVPILATTGFEGPGYADEAVRRGADAVLRKPLDRDELLRLVRILLERGERGERGRAGWGKEPGSPQAGDGAGGRVSLRVMAVGLRPGEVEAGCGATLLRHLEGGDEVALLVLSGGDTPMGERSRIAGRRMGARFYVAAGEPGTPEEFERGARRLLGGALSGAAPDVLYLCSPRRRDPLGAVLFRLALELADDVPRVFCYDAGDPEPEFQPRLFVPADGMLEGKLALLERYEAPAGSSLHPDQAATDARLWGPLVAARAAEALEVVRGDSPWGLVSP